MKRKAGYLLNMILSCIKLLFIRLRFCSIKCSLPTLIMGAELHTYGKGASIRLGKHTYIRKGAELSATNGQIFFGKGCFINKNTMIIAHELVSVGENTTIGPGVYIYDHDHNPGNKGGYKTAPIIIGSNVWIGAGAVILKGVKIGDNVVVAAGTIVNTDVPSNSMIYDKKQPIIKNKSD